MDCPALAQLSLNIDTKKKQTLTQKRKQISINRQQKLHVQMLEI